MNTTHFKQVPSRKSQSGVVLFIALISLVVLSLAAVALIRSVDTNSIITGNLTYKQTAVISSSYGIESMADTIGVRPTAYGNANDAVNGYYATCLTFDQATPVNPCNGTNLTVDASWNPGVASRLATGLGITGGVDAYGNTIQYIVERMCNQAGAVTTTRCLVSTTVLDLGDKSLPPRPVPTSLTDLPVYRLTVRVAGPKNTVSYLQAFIS